MFCEKCGAKNEKSAKFCEECGATLKKENKIKNNFKVSKKMAIIWGIVIAILITLIASYLLIKNALSPKKQAIKYFEAVVNQDIDALYDYIDVDNSGLTSKKIFKQLVDLEEDDKEEIVNYKVIGEEKVGDLYMTVTIEYVTKNSTSSNKARINFVKDKKKKYFLFDDWKIQNNAIRTIEGNQLKVLAGSKVAIAGVELKKGDLNKKESDKSFDVYDLPEMFKTKYPVKVSLPLGFDIETTITPSTYNKLEIIEIDEEDFTDKAQNELENAIKDNLKVIYKSAIDKKSFNDIKSNFKSGDSDLKDLEKSYTNFSKLLNGRTKKLTDIKFNDVEIRDLDITKDGQLEIYFKVNYEYTIKYSSGQEEKTTTDDSYTYAYMDFNYDKGYKIVDFRNLNYYFY